MPYDRLDECWIPDKWKNKIIVVDNLLPATHLNEIISFVVDSKQFAWRYSDNISSAEDAHDNFIDDYNFGWCSSALVNTSQNSQGDKIIDSNANNESFLPNTFISFLSPLLYCVKDYIGIDFIVRSRFDMTTKTSNKEYIHPPHTDFEHPYSNITCIIYLNDSDGDTIIFNETNENLSVKELTDLSLDNLTIRKRVQPKIGRVLLFDGSLIHTGCSPHNNNNRILLNSNFTNLPMNKD